PSSDGGAWGHFSFHRLLVHPAPGGVLRHCGFAAGQGAAVSGAANGRIVRGKVIRVPYKERPDISHMTDMRPLAGTTWPGRRLWWPVPSRCRLGGDTLIISIILV